MLAVRGAAAELRSDPVAVENPLEIRAEGPGHSVVSIAVTVRTPGHDAELAACFLFTEGVVRSCGEAVPSYVRKVGNVPPPPKLP
jgi:FdhD protein